MKKLKAIYVGILLSLIFIFMSCVHQEDFPVLKGPYLGQKPPGTTPEVFALGIVSIKVSEDTNCTFFPDGNEFYFTRVSGDPEIPKIMISRRTKKGWTAPEVAPFSGRHFDFGPHISPDGKYLFFASEGGIPGNKVDIYWVSAQIIEALREE